MARTIVYYSSLFCFKINAPSFYVNDNSTEKNSYTSTVGNDSNDGFGNSSVCQTAIIYCKKLISPNGLNY